MAMFAFVGFSMYLLIKKNPKGSKSMLQHANALIRYMPVDRETADLISPIFDFTNVLSGIFHLDFGCNSIWQFQKISWLGISKLFMLLF